MAVIEPAVLSGRSSSSSSIGSLVKRVCWTVVLVLVVGGGVVCGGEITCHGIRYTYYNKGLDVADVPKQPQQGIHLQICPRGVTCCTPEMETKLRTLSRETYSNSLAATAQHIQALFITRARRFDEFFKEMLSNSKRDFHFMFKKTYGILYERNSDVFTDFFKDLENYYDTGSVDLEDALRRFFEQLYQRMFTVLNSQYTFDQSYLQCVSQNMKKLQPFGDVPKKLTVQLRRSFVATRTFAQALGEAKKVIAKILKIPPRDKCAEALTRLTSCPACQGLPAIRPCTSYCMNVMKGCLAYHVEISDTWDKFVDSLIAVGERLIGPFNIEAVVEPIDIKISDAIMNFQESGYEVTQKVFQDCGQPRLGKRQAISSTSSSSSSGGNNNGFGYNYPPAPLVGRKDPAINSGLIGRPSHTSSSGSNSATLDNLVTEIVASVKETRGFWAQLPYILCQNPEVGSGRETVEANCWNGRERGVYSGRVVNDGLASQEGNPEVAVDASLPDADINEQIFALKLATNKLENAYNGHAVEWPHYEPKFPNDSGYQGSGDCYDDDEDCGRYDGGEEEGSGSGAGSSRYHDDDGDDEDDSEGSGWDDWQRSRGGGGGDPAPAWPPWVTGRTPPADSQGGNSGGYSTGSSSSSSSGSSSSIHSDSGSGGGGGGGRTTQGRGGNGHAVAGAESSLGLRLYEAVVWFAVPVAVCWLGGILF